MEYSTNTWKLDQRVRKNLSQSKEVKCKNNKGLNESKDNIYRRWFPYKANALKHIAYYSNSIPNRVSYPIKGGSFAI